MIERIFRHTVPPDAVPERLDRYLAARVPDTSRARIQKLIVEGHVRVSGRLSKASHRVCPGEALSVEIPPPAAMDLKAEPIPLAVLYEDRWLMVVDKPAGLVVHPAPGHPSATLVNALLAHGASLSSMAGGLKPGIVHRLDKDTSGLMVVAKDDQTHRDLSRQFADRKVLRVYLAVVQGVVQRDQGTIEAPIGRHPRHRQRMAVILPRDSAGSSKRRTAREAITPYRVLKRYPQATLLELSPQTGRTHQLRVHLAYLGHPILGDQRYGVGGRFPRQALHAHRLGFLHPKKNRWVKFTSPLPADLSERIRALTPKAFDVT